MLDIIYNEVLGAINALVEDLLNHEEISETILDLHDDQGRLLGEISIHRSTLSQGTNTIELTLRFKPAIETLKPMTVNFNPTDFNTKSAVLDRVLEAVKPGDVA